MFLHFFFIFTYLVFSIFSDTISSALLILHSLCIVYRYLNNKEKIDPLFLYCINVIIISMSNIVMINNVATGTVSGYYDYIIPEKISQSILIWNFGNAFIYMGFDFFRRKSFPRIDIFIRDRKKLKVLFGIMLALALKRFFIGDLDVGSLNLVLSIFSLMGIIFFARLWGMSNDKEYRNYAIVLFVTHTVIAVLYAFLRGEMVMPSVCIATGYFLGRGSFRELFSVKIVPFILMFFVFNTYFDLFGNKRGQLSNGFARITEINKISQAETSSIYTENVKQNILERSSVLPQLTNIVNLVDTRGFYLGEATKPLVIALIPRVLWPDKPLISLGSWFANEIGQSYEFEDKYTNSINMTIPGHLYVDFGWFGLFIGAVFLGGFLVCMWNACGFYESEYNITGVILGGYLLVNAVTGIGADLQIIITLFSYYLIFLIVKKLL